MDKSNRLDITVMEDRPALKGNFVYVVMWPDGTFKVGYASHRKRWRMFVCRGAELLSFFAFNTCQEALYAEAATQQWLAERYEKAFRSGTEAAAHLGHHGAGWTECFKTAEVSRG